MSNLYVYRMFEEYMTLSTPGIAPDTLEQSKEKHFAEWCRDYVSINIWLYY